MIEDSQSTSCCVYWICLESHTDMFSEGYIGISTQDIYKRFAEHKSYAKSGGSYPLSRAINKYGDDLKIKKIIEADIDYCLMIENKLRPSKRIGWNLVEGGGKPPSQLGKKHTEEALKKISEASKRNSKSPASLAAVEARRGIKRPPHVVQIVSDHNRNMKPWERGMTNKDIWCNADEIYLFSKENPKMGSVKLEKYFGLSNKSLQIMLKHFREKNWNPLQDESWIEWSKTYKFKEKETK